MHPQNLHDFSKFALDPASWISSSGVQGGFQSDGFGHRGASWVGKRAMETLDGRRLGPPFGPTPVLLGPLRPVHPLMKTEYGFEF
jgi:hypothetical protein